MMKRTISTTNICIFAGLPFLLITEALAFILGVILSRQRRDWEAGVIWQG